MTVNVSALSEISKLLKKKTGYSLWGYVWRMMMLALAIIFFVGGFKLLSFANKVSSFKDYKATSSMTESVQGEVVSCERTDKQNTFEFVVRYTVDGKDYNYEAEAYSTSRPLLGEEVDLKYDPSNPEEAGIELTPMTLVICNGAMIVSIVLLLLGGVFTVITIVIIVRIINPKKKVTEGPNTSQYDTKHTLQNQETYYPPQNPANFES